MYTGPTIQNKFDAEIASAISGRKGQALSDLMNAVRESFPDDESMTRFFEYACPEEVIGFVCLRDIELGKREARRKGTMPLTWHSLPAGSQASGGE